MKPSRIVLLVVALLAGGLAAFLATQHEPAVPQTVKQPVSETVPVARTQILVVKQTIGAGQRLSPAMLEWQDWPAAALRPEYVDIAKAPGAITDMSGSVARVDLFAGEPIRQEKLAPPGGGFLSAILDKGMRGVSVSVGAESASGGFIRPDDHVDVLLTSSTGAGQQSQIILRDVRVLAINAKLGETAPPAGATAAAAAPEDPKADVFAGQAIATLALDSTQAELITNATTLGKLTLLLRPAGDSADSSSAEERAANMAIRLSSPFWTARGGSTSQVSH